MSAEFKLDLPKHENVVSVRTTNNRGFTPDELAEACVAKIISVSDTAVFNAITDAGHPELAELIRRL